MPRQNSLKRRRAKTVLRLLDLERHACLGDCLTVIRQARSWTDGASHKRTSGQLPEATSTGRVLYIKLTAPCPNLRLARYSGTARALASGRHKITRLEVFRCYTKGSMSN